MHRGSLPYLLLRVATRTTRGRRCAIAAAGLTFATVAVATSSRAPHHATFCSEVRSPWTPAQPIEREYAFASRSRADLDKVLVGLQARGYSFSSACDSDCGFGDDRSLTMRKTEQLTPELFRDRETELCAFAQELSISGVWVIVPSDPAHRKAQEALSGSASPTGI